MLNGIDVSSWQSGIDLANVPSDFVIVKATGGTSYANPDFRRQADQALKAGRKLGIYHYAYERTGWGTAEQEAEFFLKAFEPYKGKAIPILDFENDAQSLPIDWPKKWLDKVAAETGARAWFYAYASYLNSRDHSAMQSYPLWMASYLDEFAGKGYQRDPRQIWDIGGWNYLTCYQYTSEGRLNGWNKNLDLNVFYGDREDWDSMCGGHKPERRIVHLGEEAAEIHAHMCNDDRYGYSWEERHGQPGKVDRFTTGSGTTYDLVPGDYDCSSSTIDAWKLALSKTKFAGKLDGATYTGNMRSVFTSSGLFEWKGMDFLAHTGDLYLNEANHVAMCQTQTPDVLSEFSWGDKGAYGNQRGDQSGTEASVHAYYDYPWDGILHYNGKADYQTDGKPEPTPEPEHELRFRIKQGGRWQDEGFKGVSGASIQAIAIDMPGWYQVCTARHGWLDPVDGYDVGEPSNGYAGWLDSPVIAVRCYYETPDPSSTGYRYIEYRVSDVGEDWWPWQRDNEVDASQDGYAGDFRPIDRFEARVVS